MSKYIVDENTMKGIANSIRTADGSSATILGKDLAGKVGGLEEAIEFKNLPIVSRKILTFLGSCREDESGGYTQPHAFYEVEVHSNNWLLYEGTFWGYRSDGTRIDTSQINSYYYSKVSLPLTYSFIQMIFAKDLMNSVSGIKFKAVVQHLRKVKDIQGTPCTSPFASLTPVVIAADSSTGADIRAILDFKIVMIPQSKVLPLETTCPVDNSIIPLIFVNNSYVNQYKSATNWVQFKDRIFPMSTYTGWVN